MSFFAISDAAARARRTMEVLMKMRKFDKTSEWQKERRNSFPEYFAGENYSVNVEEVVTYITKFCVGEAINSARVRRRDLEKFSSRVPKNEKFFFIAHKIINHPPLPHPPSLNELCSVSHKQFCIGWENRFFICHHLRLGVEKLRKEEFSMRK